MNGWLTPDLAENPQLALAVAKSPQPHILAPVVSHSKKVTAAQDAIAEHQIDENSSSFWNSLGHGALTTLEWANKPLQEIQKDYKFVHSVYTKHGILEGFIVTLGVVAGGVAGAAVGGAVGAAIGSDLAASALRRGLGVKFTDSYKDSENPLYKVSAGRDFSNLVGASADILGADAAAKAFHNTDAGAGKFLSGGTDLIFDVSRDPINIIAKFGMAMRGGKLLKLDTAGAMQVKYPIMSSVPGIKNFIVERTGRLISAEASVVSEQMDAVRAGSGIFNKTARQYNRAIEDIADTAKNAKSSAEAAGIIASKYPTLGTAAAGHLGGIKTADDVHEFLKSVLFTGELAGTIAGKGIMPARTLLRARLGDNKVIEGLRTGIVEKMIKDPTNPAKWIDNPEWKLLSPTRLASNVYKTFSGYMPYSVNIETGKLSTQKFKWDAPDAATVIYRVARFGMGDEGAKIWAGKYAEAVASKNIGDARAIKAEAFFHTFKALGLPDNNEFVLQVRAELDSLGQESMGQQIYGVDAVGKSLGQYMTPSGPKVAGLYPRHYSDIFDIPNFNAIKTHLHDAGMIKKTVGYLDDFVGDNYTNRIFKPLALATTGFGLRIAASEMIPAIARYGFVQTFKAGLGKAAAKTNTKITKAEAPHIFAAAMTALGAGLKSVSLGTAALFTGSTTDLISDGFYAFQEAKRRGLTKAAEMLAPEQLELATRLIITNGGHLTSEAIATGHGASATTSQQMTSVYYQVKKHDKTNLGSTQYSTYSSENASYIPMLNRNYKVMSASPPELNITNDLVASKIKSGTKFQVISAVGKETEYKLYLAVRQNLIDKEFKRIQSTKSGTSNVYKDELNRGEHWNADLYSFATDRVDGVLGKFIGNDGTYLQDFASKVATGREITQDEITAIYRTTPLALPSLTEGALLENVVPKRMFEAVIDFGFKKIVDPIINNLSREPMYLMHVAEEYAMFKPLILKKQMTEDQALRHAQSRAVFAMLPEIHNVALRSQFAQYARNILPFYFAQEQAYKRVYLTLKDTSVGLPVFSKGLRYFQLAEQGMNNPAFVQHDENGNRYITLPGVGALGEALQNTMSHLGWNIVANLPVTAQGNLVSLKTVLPELSAPGTTPFISIGANWIAKLFPSLGDKIQPVIGDIAYNPATPSLRGSLDSLIPSNWAKNIFRGLTMDEQDSQVASAIASALAAAYYHEQIPGQKEGFEPTAPQMQDFVNTLKNNVRTILFVKGLAGLVSPLSPKVKIEDVGMTAEFYALKKKKGNFADALIDFIGKYGATAVAYTTSRTSPAENTPSFRNVAETTQFINDNADKFNKNSPVATGWYYLVPQNQDAKYDYNVFNDLLHRNLIKTRQPAELLKQFYISQGDYANSAAQKQHYANLELYKFNSYSTNLENQKWQEHLKDMRTFFPTWDSEQTFGGGVGNAQKAVDQLNTILSADNAPKHPQALLVKDLLQKFNTHIAKINSYSSMNITGFLVTSEKDAWKKYLYDLSQSTPELAPIIYSVFNKLG